MTGKLKVSLMMDTKLINIKSINIKTAEALEPLQFFYVEILNALFTAIITCYILNSWII